MRFLAHLFFTFLVLIIHQSISYRLVQWSITMGIPNTSRRIQRTDDPVIVHMQSLMRSNPSAKSLAQGVVHWKPPQSAIDCVANSIYHRVLYTNTLQMRAFPI